MLNNDMSSPFDLDLPRPPGHQGNHWEFKNPTRTTLDEIGVMLEDNPVLGDRRVTKLEKKYRRGDRRVEFMSVFPVRKDA